MRKFNISWEPYGKALKAYWKGNKDVTLSIHMDDDSITEMPLKVYFREESEIPELESYALDLCRGKVLDVGAGAGPHSEILLSEGHEVYCIDVAPEAIEILKSKDVLNAFQSSFLDFKPDHKFDTLLFMMNGIGIAGNLEGLKEHLLHAHKLTHNKSQIILDSSDLRLNQEVEPESEHYFGEITYRLSFDNSTGAPYQWLYVDAETLQKIAEETGWSSQVVFQEEDGAYLARLTKSS